MTITLKKHHGRKCPKCKSDAPPSLGIGPPYTRSDGHVYGECEFICKTCGDLFYSMQSTSETYLRSKYADKLEAGYQKIRDMDAAGVRMKCTFGLGKTKDGNQSFP